MPAPLALGIDIGGTFTDIVIFDPATGQARIGKVSTTPDDPAEGAMEGVRQLLAAHDIAPARIGRVVHATTLFTNALIERKGARTGLLTTAGFRDTLEIGRERKYELYDLFIEMPAPLVPRAWRREVAERLAPDGSVEIALDVDALLREAAALVEAGVESLAVVFLHAYANAVHERMAADVLARRFPHVSVSLSSDIAPELREYPRASTTVANAYVRPLAERYLDQLEARLLGIGITGGFFLMLSSGGLTHVAEAKRAPVQLLESGPAAGALAGAWFGRNAGLERVLAFDMGGTTAKLALVDGGEPLVAFGFEAARAKRFLRGSGLPIQIPTIELIEIGAGGGSIARRSELETLHVGPDSAGADPGPACYARGGVAPTVTDADLLLGYLNADFFLGGAMTIDARAAAEAVGVVASALGMDAMRAAYGIHDVVNENMAGAARVAIAERGRIPHEYALMATGGAAPVHAWQVARKLGVKRLVCPPGAGVGSTIGMLMAQARADRVASLHVALDLADWVAVAAAFDRLRAEALAVVARTGAEMPAAAAQRLADMRYVGQGSEITVALPAVLDAQSVRAAFETTYRALYGRTPPGAAIQFVALRLVVSAPMPGSGGVLAQAAGVGPALKGTRAVWFPEADGLVATLVYDRYALRPGDIVAGPAVFEETESTFIIGPGGRAVVRDDGTIDVAMPAFPVMAGPRDGPKAHPRTGSGRPSTTLPETRTQIVAGRAKPHTHQDSGAAEEDSPPPLAGGGWGEGWRRTERWSVSGTNPSPHPWSASRPKPARGGGAPFVPPPPYPDAYGAKPGHDLGGGGRGGTEPGHDTSGGRDTSTTFDPITLELLWRRLISLVDEAAAALVRTSFSTLVRESYDFSCIVTDDQGQSLVQATESIPSFIGTLPATVKHFLRFFPPETLAPGDVLITNDLWLGTGHLPDITVAKPIFRNGRLVAFSASTAHAPDIGGKIRSPEPREVFEEGLQIPPWKLLRAGETDATLVALIRKNVRTPDQTMGDLWAQVVALDLMEERLGALMAAYELDDLRSLAGEIHGRCERAMRAAIAALPDGTYRSELQTDGVADKPVTIRMALTIAGDTIDIDYSGTDPQVDRAINCALCYTYAMSVYGVKVCTSPTLPNNEGGFRPIGIRAPDGCIVNPMFPASGGSRMLIGHYLPMLVFGCLGQVVPERVMAACGSPMWGMNQSGVRADGKPYANMFFFNGGMGATMRGDGQSCLSWPSNVSSTSVEISEHIAPLRFHHKRLRGGSGGAGRHRGGLGQEILVESRSDRPIAVSFLAERTIFPAFGIEGGAAGAPGVLRINGAAVDPKRQYVLHRGDSVLLATPGGGGHGDPGARAADALHDDRLAGYTEAN